MNENILLRQSNVVSLRTAYVSEGDNLVELCLMPADITSKIPQGRDWLGPQDFKWASEDSVWVYRHLGSADEELNLKNGPLCLEQKIRAIQFKTPPLFKLQWSDSGHSVALFINDEPWAFIDEATRRGFSKGMLDATWKNQWNQELFEKIFPK